MQHDIEHAGRMSDCLRAREVIQQRCDEPLCAAEEAALAEHLASCEACRCFAAEMQALCGDLDDLRMRSDAACDAEFAMAAQVPDRAKQRGIRIAAEQHAPAGPRTRNRAQRLVFGGSFAAAAAAVLAFALIYPRASPHPSSRDGAQTAPQSPVQAVLSAELNQASSPAIANAHETSVELLGESGTAFIALPRATTVPNVHLFIVLPVVRAASGPQADEQQPAL